MNRVQNRIEKPKVLGIVADDKKVEVLSVDDAIERIVQMAKEHGEVVKDAPRRVRVHKN